MKILQIEAQQTQKSVRKLKAEALQIVDSVIYHKFCQEGDMLELI